jgi:Arc/MetJ-type ribon-helix-helix transcriptional regulator
LSSQEYELPKTRDRRFTVSVAEDVADKLDEYVRHTQNANRSEVVEQALRLWDRLAEFRGRESELEEALRLYHKQQERELYRAYYAELSDAAKEEDSAWSELNKESAADRWPPSIGSPVFRESK